MTTSQDKWTGAPVYQGCGNSFVMVDDRLGLFPSTDLTFIRSLSQKTDGLILLQYSEKADFRMRIFNKDGSEATMCGNGLRCLIRFIQDLSLDSSTTPDLSLDSTSAPDLSLDSSTARDLSLSSTSASDLSLPRFSLQDRGMCSSKWKIETGAGVLKTFLDSRGIAVEMGAPQEIVEGIQLFGHTWHHINTGTPHLVTFVADIERTGLMELGKKMRHHEHFHPVGVNVNFAHIYGNRISMRTFEKGVEGETLGCGTGAVAVAFLAHKLYDLKDPLTVITRSGEPLYITLSPLTMIGNAIKDAINRET